MDIKAFLVERHRLRQSIISAREASPEGPQEMVWVARAVKFYFFSRSLFKKAQVLNKPIVRFALGALAMHAAGAFLPAKLAALFIQPKTEI